MGDPRDAEDTPFDPEERWSVGLAADRAGVTHNEFIDWVRRGRLEVEAVRREGVEIRVVRAGDVAAIAPRAARSVPSGSARPARMEPPPPARPSATSEPPGADADPREAGAQGRRSPSPDPATSPAPAEESAAPEAPREPEPEPAPALPRRREAVATESGPGAGPGAPSSAERAALDELRGEIARLRAELDARPRTPAQPPFPPVPPVMKRALAGAAAFGAALGVVVGLLFGDIDGHTAAASAAEGVASAPAEERAGGTPQPPLPGSAGSATSGAPREAAAGEWPRRRRAEERGDEAAPKAQGSVSHGAESPDARTPDARTTDAGAADRAPEPEATPPPMRDRAPAAARQPDRAPPPWTRDVTEPRWLADIGAPSSTASEPCAFRAILADGDEDLLLTLGPCHGAPGEDAAGGPGPGGTHRVAGVHVCAHHAFIERVKRASRDPDARAELAAEAEAARAQGLAPPVLRLRADRAAGAFLRDVVGLWVDCGLDGRPPRGVEELPEHGWSAPRIVAGEGGAPAVRMSLSSWVRVREGGPLRPFEMDLLLGDGPRGDRLDGLRWASAPAERADDAR